MTAPPTTTTPPQVALFITCLTDTFYPRVGEAVVRVLRHFGCDVCFPSEQTCCGQPAHNSGQHQLAASVARRMISVFEQYPHVVTPSASCAAMVTQHFGELLADDRTWGRRAADLAERTFEFTVFVRDVLGVDPADHLRFDQPFTFHYPCHARHAYSPDELIALLRRAGGDLLRVPRYPDLCCGFGGVFSVDYPEISGAMLGDKLDQLAATGAKLVVCNEAGCGLNMAGGADRRGLELRFKHIAELLAESLELMPAEVATS